MPAERCILYVDADRFYFSVEAIERPELAAETRPVIVGRDPREAPRGVVTTSNNAARALGIGSGLSCVIALRKAPNAIFIPPRHDIYSEYSRRFVAVLRDASPLVQQNSIDEAACEWGHNGFHQEPALALRQRVLDEVGISLSMGLAANALLGKMASEAAKSAENHLKVIRPGEEAEFLRPLEIRALPGIGPKSGAKLVARDIATIGDVADMTMDQLEEAFGKAYAQFLHEASHGTHHYELHAERVSKSISAEHTFPADTADRRVLWEAIQSQAEEVSRRMRKEGLVSLEVAIKLRYSNFYTILRQSKLAAATDVADDLALAAAELMRRHYEKDRAVRLIGLRAGRLAPPTQPVEPAQPSLLDSAG